MARPGQAHLLFCHWTISAHQRYLHLGVPTDRPQQGETYLEAFKVFVSGFESSPYGVQWMRYEAGSPVDELIRSVPHLAFEVADLETAIAGKQVLTAPNSPSPGVTVAMIVDNGCPIELIHFAMDWARRPA